MAQIGEILVEFDRWLRVQPNMDLSRSTEEVVHSFLLYIDQESWMPNKGADLTHAGIVNALVGQRLTLPGQEDWAIGPISANLIADLLVSPNGRPTIEAMDDSPPEPDKEPDPKRAINIPAVVGYLESVALGHVYMHSDRVAAAAALMRWFDTVTYDRTTRELEIASDANLIPDAITWKDGRFLLRDDPPPPQQVPGTCPGCTPARSAVAHAVFCPHYPGRVGH